MAVGAALLIGAEQTFLTHFTHRVSHAALTERLPVGIAPAYDGLVVPIGASPVANAAEVEGRAELGGQAR
jgi:phosphoribosyl 1,2-cyclic phosphodiesterase